MEVKFKTSKELITYYDKIKYFVLFPDKKLKGFTSLREISREIYIDYSTISKRLSESNPCVCYSSGNEYVFLVQKVLSNGVNP
tara:strand:- start:7496 stop:7744 length:249 start_codon:yes stop_codon:yes gene_type:complete